MPVLDTENIGFTVALEQKQDEINRLRAVLKRIANDPSLSKENAVRKLAHETLED